jgi:hypothetical protein
MYMCIYLCLDMFTIDFDIYIWRDDGSRVRHCIGGSISSDDGMERASDGVPLLMLLVLLLMLLALLLLRRCACDKAPSPSQKLGTGT